MTGFACDFTETKMPVQQRAEFEVAFVKRSVSRQGMIGWKVFPGGRVVIAQATLQMLIEYAFDVRPFQVSAGPDWSVTTGTGMR